MHDTSKNQSSRLHDLDSDNRLSKLNKSKSFDRHHHNFLGFMDAKNRRAISTNRVVPAFLLQLQQNDSRNFELMGTSKDMIPVSSASFQQVLIADKNVSSLKSFPKLKESIISHFKNDISASKTFKQSRSNSSNSMPKSYLSVLKYLPIEELGVEKSFMLKNLSLADQKIFANHLCSSEVQNEDLDPYGESSIISRVRKNLKKEDIDFLMSLKNLPVEEIDVTNNPFKTASNQLLASAARCSEIAAGNPYLPDALQLAMQLNSNQNLTKLEKALLNSFKHDELINDIIKKFSENSESLESPFTPDESRKNSLRLVPARQPAQMEAEAFKKQSIAAKTEP